MRCHAENFPDADFRRSLWRFDLKHRVFRVLALIFSAFLAAKLLVCATEVLPSGAIVEAEAIYADLVDCYGIISAIDSDLFATYRGKNRTAWESVYSEKRKQLKDALTKISAS